MNDRYTVDSITSDALDQLYDQLAAAEQLTNRLAHALAAEFDTTVDTVLDEARNAIGDTTARPTYQQLQQRLDHAEEELRHHHEAHSADAAAGSYAHRAEHAEAAIARAHRIADLIDAGAPWTASHRDTANRIREALNGEQAIEPALAATEATQEQP